MSNNTPQTDVAPAPPTHNVGSGLYYLLVDSHTGICLTHFRTKQGLWQKMREWVGEENVANVPDGDPLEKAFLDDFRKDERWCYFGEALLGDERVVPV